MNSFEKRLCILAVICILIYIGAILITLSNRVDKKEVLTRIESVQPDQGERTILLAELLLPMLILATLTICFILVKKKRAAKKLLSKNEDNEDFDYLAKSED